MIRGKYTALQADITKDGRLEDKNRKQRKKSTEINEKENKQVVEKISKNKN